MSGVGDKIRKAREYKKISQEALGNEFGIDYTQINRMELGKVNFSISYLSRIAQALGIPPKELIP